MAQRMLTTSPIIAQQTAQLLGYDEEVVKLLLSVGRELWDALNLQSEHILAGQAKQEAGFDFEMSLWGGIAMNANQNRYTAHARQIRNIPYILASRPFPFRYNPPEEGYVQEVAVLGMQAFPVEDYITPMTLDWIAQFFSQKWWDQVFGAFGHEALKLRPYNSRLLKTMMNTEWVRQEDKIEAYGRDETKFLNLCAHMFGENGNALVGEYILAMAEQPLLPQILTNRWSVEVDQWNYAVLAPLENSMERLNDWMKTAIQIVAKVRKVQGDLQSYYTAYLEGWKQQAREGNIVGGPGPLSLEQFANQMTQNLGKMVGAGGVLMKSSLETYNYMVHDIARIQRMVFDYFSMTPEARAEVYSGLGEADNGYIGQLYQRLVRIRDVTERFIQGFTGLTKIEELSKIKHNWAVFIKLYTFLYQRYRDLLAMLGEQGQFHPNDIKWKQRFASIPSSYWVSRMDRLRTLMQREYVRMDPRMRKIVDECDAIVRRYPGAKGVLSAPLTTGETDADSVAKVMEQITNVGQNLPAESIGPFNWTAPTIPTAPAAPANQQSGTQPQPPQPPQPQQPAQPEAPKPIAFSRIVFGRTNKLEGSPPSRTSSEEESPNPFQNTRTSSPFDDLKASSQPNAFGPGGPIPTSDPDQTTFRRRKPAPGEFQAPIFPNPYATPDTSTADLVAFDQEQLVANALFGMQLTRPKDQYATDDAWRDPGEPLGNPESPPPQFLATPLPPGTALLSSSAFSAPADPPGGGGGPKPQGLEGGFAPGALEGIQKAIFDCNDGEVDELKDFVFEEFVASIGGDLSLEM